MSSSWGECEADAGQGYAQDENITSEQMAAQGQSMFSSAGDTGAYDCIREGSGSADRDCLEVDDPAPQPRVTSVGGTSLESDNPGTHPYRNILRGLSRSGTWTTSAMALQRGCSGTTAPEPVVADPVSAGADRATSGVRASITARRRLALPIVPRQRPVRPAVKCRTSQLTRMTTRRTASTAQTLTPAAPAPSTRATRAGIGSGWAAPACLRRCGRRFWSTA